jgi:hypothetical protein
MIRSYFFTKVPSVKFIKPFLRWLLVSLPIFLLSFGTYFTCQAQPKFVATRGKEFIAPGGRALFLKGINLGNWLMPEGYMLKFNSANSPRLIQVALPTKYPLPINKVGCL